MHFMEQIAARAKADIKTIVLPESTDIRTLQAASIIQKQGLANVVLVGDEDQIKDLAGSLDLSNVKIISPNDPTKSEKYSQLFYEMRKNKGISIEQAKALIKKSDDAWRPLAGKVMLDEDHCREIMKNPLFFGVMMVKCCDADGMVAGAIHSTPDTIRPALQILKTAPHTKLVSSFFVMDVPNCEYGENGTFVFSDCGLIENPTSEELAEIAIASANSFSALVNKEPKVAMLSYSTLGSNNSEHTLKVLNATRLAKAKAPHLQIDGELQLDAAIVPSVGKSKAPSSKIAGNANVLIFPDLNAGNIGYKLVQRLAKAEAYGPILQGIAKPVNDLSRGCSAQDIVGVVAITAVQAQGSSIEKCEITK